MFTLTEELMFCEVTMQRVYSSGHMAPYAAGAVTLLNADVRMAFDVSAHVGHQHCGSSEYSWLAPAACAAHVYSGNDRFPWLRTRSGFVSTARHAQSASELFSMQYCVFSKSQVELVLDVSAHAAAHGAVNAVVVQPEHAAGASSAPAIVRHWMPEPGAGTWRDAHTFVMNARACATSAGPEHVEEHSVMPGTVSRAVHADWSHGQPAVATPQQLYADDVRRMHVVVSGATTSVNAMGVAGESRTGVAKPMTDSNSTKPVTGMKPTSHASAEHEFTNSTCTALPSSGMSSSTECVRGPAVLPANVDVPLYSITASWPGTGVSSSIGCAFSAGPYSTTVPAG